MDIIDYAKRRITLYAFALMPMVSCAHNAGVELQSDYSDYLSCHSTNAREEISQKGYSSPNAKVLCMYYILRISKPLSVAPEESKAIVCYLLRNKESLREVIPVVLTDMGIERDSYRRINHLVATLISRWDDRLLLVQIINYVLDAWGDTIDEWDTSKTGTLPSEILPLIDISNEMDISDVLKASIKKRLQVMDMAFPKRDRYNDSGDW